MEDEASTSLDGKLLGNLRVVDLKQELEKRGLSKSGSKKDLVKRLKQQLEFEKLCEERKSSGDLIRKIELDAEIQQNEFVQQYLAQQQKRYAEREEEKRLQLEAMHKQDQGSPVISSENQGEDEQIAVSDSDENNEKSVLSSKPSTNEQQNETIEHPKLHTSEPIKKVESHSSSSESEHEQSNPLTPVSENVSVEQGNFKCHNQDETGTDQNNSQSSIDAETKQTSQNPSPSFSLREELTKSEQKSTLNTVHTTENIESVYDASAHSISHDTKQQNNSKSDNPEKSQSGKSGIIIEILKDENDNVYAIQSSDIKKHTESTEVQSVESASKEEERNIDSPHASPEVALSSELLPKHQVAEDMESSECSSVPYPLSDIKLPDSPVQVSKCKEIKNESNKIEPSSEKEDKSTPLINNTQPNGNGASDALNSSHEEVMSESETKETSNSSEPEKSSQRRDSRDSRQSDESSDESDRNDTQYKKKSFSYEDTSSNMAGADSDEGPSKETAKKRHKSRQQSDESDNDKSSDSDKYSHHLDSKRKSHSKHRKRNRRSRSRSSSTSSRHSSDSAPKHRHSKKLSVTKNENLTENDESNQMPVKNLDDKSKDFKKGDSVVQSTVVSSVSNKKRLKIKRDNVPVEVTSISVAESSKKSVEKSNSVSAPDTSSKKESTEVKEIQPEVPYTCRKVNLSNRRLNRKSSEDKSNEPKLKRSKWESFAACQKSSSTISISTDSLKNWFPDFKLISEASSSMELETDEQSSSAVDEKNINIIHDVSNENDAVMRQESTSQIENEDSESMEPSYGDALDQGPVSKIIFIQNLVRPFTLNQLKELLKQNGKIVEEHFWIDKIKSKCFVMYETEKEAIKARNALNNTRWPSSNPKILSVEFSNEEELEQHKKGNEPPPPKPIVEPPAVEIPEVIETRTTHPVEEHKRKDRERRKERERSKHQAPVREWDKDKIMQDSPEREHIPKDEKSRSSEKKEKKESKKRPNEDTPAKLLDDLFQKTKNPPCIYWLPLTEEQAKQKEDAKKLRKLEREKRNQQLREQEAERRNKRARSNRRSREKENRKSSTRSRSPVSRRR